LVVTLILSLNACTKNYFSFYLNFGRIDPYYLAFSVLGLSGSLLALFRVSAGKWMIYLFYSLQVLFIYGDGWRLVLLSGLEFSIKILNGYIDTAFQSPQGFGINLLAITLLILTLIFVGRGAENSWWN
jgi:hypothetical protein